MRLERQGPIEVRKSVVGVPFFEQEAAAGDQQLRVRRFGGDLAVEEDESVVEKGVSSRAIGAEEQRHQRDDRAPGSSPGAESERRQRSQTAEDRIAAGGCGR
jgi:hypothetical protein